jgi:hypothetical protein
MRRRSFAPATCSRKCLARSRRSRPVTLLSRAGEAVWEGDHNR